MTFQILSCTIFTMLLAHVKTLSWNSTDRTQRFISMPSYMYSISDLEFLERFEIAVVRNLAKTFETLQRDSKIRQMVHAYLKDFNKSKGYKEVVDNREEAIRPSESPICSFRLIRRIAVSLRQLVSKRDFVRFFGPLWRQVTLFFLQNGWPNIADVEGFAEKILRIQHVYDLDVEQLAEGKIDTVLTNCTLDSSHCYEIANFALKTEQYASAIQWLQLAKEKALVDRKSSMPLIELALWDAVEMHNMELHGKDIMELQPIFFSKKINHNSKTKRNPKTLRKLQYEAFKEQKSDAYVMYNYWGLCTEDIEKSDIAKKQLFCWYEFKVHPSFVIGPVKMEFLGRNPDIVQIYEVLSQTEMENFIADCDRTPPYSIPVASYKLALPATTYIYSSGHTNCRPSAAEHLDRKLERMTGLNIRHASEDIKFLSYSVGGHIYPHFDWQSRPHDDMIQELWRVATMMLYLSDVKKGGETVFTSAGVIAKPVKGSAVLWFNHFADGSEDFKTLHGSCPVLTGSKWAANRWILYDPQFSNRKCGLKWNERYQVPVNGVYLPQPTYSGAEKSRWK